jgi:fructose-1,6-bisphosphatase
MITLDAHPGARVLDLVPTSPHQRVPLLIGSPEDVRLAEEFYAARRT